jgi:hypothetical protein
MKLRILERYQCQHHTIAGVPSFKQLLQYVESEISMPVSLARLEDSSGLTHMFLCCYVDTHIRVYNCEELMGGDSTTTVHACEGNTVLGIVDGVILVGLPPR